MACHTKENIDKYRTFPEAKEEVLGNLKVLFDKKSPYITKIIQDGKFTKTFFTIVNRNGRMQILKELLLEIDKTFYSNISFE